MVDLEKWLNLWLVSDSDRSKEKRNNNAEWLLQSNQQLG